MKDNEGILIVVSKIQCKYLQQCGAWDEKNILHRKEDTFYFEQIVCGEIHSQTDFSV